MLYPLKKWTVRKLNSRTAIWFVSERRASRKDEKKTEERNCKDSRLLPGRHCLVYTTRWRVSLLAMAQLCPQHNPPCAPVRCCLLSGYRTKCQIFSIVWTLFLSIIFLVLMPKEVSSVELAGRRRGALQAVNLPTVQTIISNHIGFCGYVNVSWIMSCSGA